MFQTRAMVIFFVGLGCGTLIAVGEREIVARCTDGCKGYCLEASCVMTFVLVFDPLGVGTV
eukprot:scaffold156249_cov52-Attheya_sp.AAC.2